MKELNFIYRMELHFSEPVRNHYFALRCVPSDHQNQKITHVEWNACPSDGFAEVQDGFGNRKIVGHCMEEHDTFLYEIKGSAAIEGMKEQVDELHPMYKYPSAYTKWGNECERFLQEWMTAENMKEKKEETNLEKALCVMHFLYAHFTYKSGITNIDTTAEQALGLRTGVCQDYAHIMIAVLRRLGIPARYVNGLMIGEGATHAWVEVYTGTGWYGLDPTNDLHVDDYYIKLAHGRDYGDCVLDKGRFMGAAKQEQKIYVSVSESERRDK